MRLALLVAVAACGPAASGPGTVAPQLPVVAPSQPTVPTTTWDQLKGPIRTVEVIAADVGLRGELATLFASEVSQVVDRARLRDRLDAAMAVRGVAEVAARGVQLDGGIKLIIDVTPQPILRKLTAVEVGGAPIALTGIAATRTGLMFDPAAIERIAADLRDRYHERGHQDVEVAWRKVAVKEGVEVTIDVTTGAATLIDGLDVTGNKAISSQELRAALAKHLTVGKPVREEAIALASMEVQALYWDRGYANINVKSPAPAAGRVVLVFEIVEGELFRLGPIAVTGVPASEVRRYVAVLGIKQGDIFNRTAIAKARLAVVDEARAAGINVADVVPLTKVDLAKKTIDLTFELSKNP